ncbi:MAG: magnesium transporter [Longimicrobiales bacterium]
MDQPLSAELLYLLAGDPADLASALGKLRTADIAELLNTLAPEAAARVISAIPFDYAVQLFDEPELERRGEIFSRLEPGTAAALIEAMSADQQVDLFRLLDERERERLLPRLAPATRETLRQLLRYPPDTAGGIMTTEFVSVPGTWTVGQALQHIHDVGRAKETVYAIYVTDSANRLVHVVSLRELIVADREQTMALAGDKRRPISVGPLIDREEVARLIGKYNLLAIPVVDTDQRILGIVTVDDVIDALIEEATEDVQAFGGLEALDEPYLDVRFGTMVRKRAGWLAALFIGEMLTATAMAYFEDEIARAVILALFVPLIISSGGNSGSQAATLVIRAMALGEVRPRDGWRVFRREFGSGLALGLLLGTIGLLRILLWQAIGDVYGEHYMRVALTVSFSLVGVVMFGTLAGSMLPFLLRRLGLDPAKASAPFVATLVDVTGIVIYFTLAALLLRGALL